MHFGYHNIVMLGKSIDVVDSFFVQNEMCPGLFMVTVPVLLISYPMGKN